jgi:hypothetical protein
MAMNYSVHLDGKAYLVQADDALSARQFALSATGLHDGNFEACYLLEDLPTGATDATNQSGN